MLISRTEYQHKRQTIPKRHHPPQHTSQQGCYLNMSALVQSVQLRMGERSHGQLVSCHQPCYGRRSYIVSKGHKKFDAVQPVEMQRNCCSRRKMKAPKEFAEDGTHGVRHEIQG